MVEHLAQQTDASWEEGEGEYLFAQGLICRTPVIFVKPTTFMNRSGVAVVALRQQFEIPLEELLVVSDDVNLPLGKIRLRSKGSDGGHKGLASLVYQLGSDYFPRLRLGIGLPPEEMELVEYVLSDFNEREIASVKEMILRATEAIKVFVTSGMKEAISFLARR